MVKRIELVIQSQNLSPSQFADRIGIQRSGLSHILSGRNNPSLDFVQKVLAAFPDLNPTWFLQGKGRMYVNLSGMENATRKEGMLSIATPVASLSEEGNAKAESWEEEMEAPERSFQDEGPGPVESLGIAGSKAPGLRKILLFYEDGTFEEYAPRN